ncbi:doublecortin domain-containing protein 2 isoform X2 [Octopus bimaculoides]|uniref:Doublecortin domain-containing protein n=1 Tax=Octopus bimaculoides TaxID=37653 RepID=A0A0L8I3U2_OCTBM|nr:doublecortin domain-containing protein 2 isoform X2 [Octopus bimaculoides]|eukprot:XP_014791079.1 PREDICTED: doublecortin domain-containing protein 2-like isoform X2 [Octopus bimaculoides]
MAKAANAQDSETTEVKNVQIFCNGNKFAPPRHVVLNTRHIRNFDNFLDELTRILNPLQGAIRRLYTPVNGNPVEDTTELQEGGGYVAAGKERFKKLNYFEIQPIRRTKGPKFPYFDIKPVTHSQFRVSGKVKKINIQSKKIVVFPNGQFFLPPSIIVLNQTEQTSMDTVMHSVGIKVDLPQGGFPERLYTLDGDRVDHTDKVTNGTMYVAASHREKFKPGPYGPYMRMGPLRFPLRLTPLNRKKYEAKGSDSEISQENSTSSDYSSSKRSRKSRATVRENENGVFHARQLRRKKSPEKAPAKQPDYDRDQGGVFKAKEKNPETRHANVVSESADTKMDEPVDNMAAEQINEEKLSDKESRSKNTSIKKSEKEQKKTNEVSGNQRSKNPKNADVSSSKKPTANNGESAKDQISGQAAPDAGVGNSTSSSKNSDQKNTTDVAGEKKATDEPKNSKTVRKPDESLVDNHANTPPAQQIFSQKESNKQVGDGSSSASSKAFDNDGGAAQNDAKDNDDRVESPKVEPTKDGKAETNDSNAKADDQRISDNRTLDNETPMSEPNAVEKDPFESSVSPVDGAVEREDSLLSNNTKTDDNLNAKQPEQETDEKNAQNILGSSGDKSNTKDTEELDKPLSPQERDVINSPPIESSVDRERSPSVQSPPLSESLTSDQLSENKAQESNSSEVPKDDNNALNSSQDMNNVADIQQNENHNNTGNSKELEKQSNSNADETNPPKVPASTNG